MKLSTPSYPVYLVSCPVPHTFLTPHTPGSSVPFLPKLDSCHPLPQSRLVNSYAPPGPHSKPPLYKLLLGAALGEGGCYLLPGLLISLQGTISFCLSPQP